MGRVTFVYKSGAKVRVRAEELIVTRRDGVVVAVEWKTVVVAVEWKTVVVAVEWKTIDPRPLYLDVDEIESVWAGKA